MRGQGSVFKRKGSPYWQIAWYVAGKRHTETSKSLKKGDAQDLLLRRRQEYRLVPGWEKRATVSEVLAEYERDAELRGVRRLKPLEYRAKLICEFMGHHRAVEVNAARVRELQEHLSGSGYGNGTINAVVSVLKTALRLAALDGRIPTVPAFPRRMKDPLPRQGFLEHEDFTAILEELPGWAADVFSFLYWSGWRKMEALTLSWTEVDLDGRMIRLNPSRSKSGEGRSLPLVGEIGELIRERAAVRVVGAPWVFHKDGRRISSTTFRSHFVQATVIAGREGVIPHDTRRTAARNLERARVPRGVAMKLLGHKTEGIYQRYAITAEDELAGGAEKLYEYLRTRPTRKILKFGGGE